MRGRVPVFLAAGCLLLAAGCLPSSLRLPAERSEALRKIAVVPVESPGMFARISNVIPSPGGLVRLAGAHDNGILAPDSHGLLYEGAPVFVRLPGTGDGIGGRAERFEKALAGPRPVWNPAVDLAEACARALRESGRDPTAYREARPPSGDFPPGSRGDSARLAGADVGMVRKGPGTCRSAPLRRSGRPGGPAGGRRAGRFGADRHHRHPAGEAGRPFDRPRPRKGEGGGHGARGAVLRADSRRGFNSLAAMASKTALKEMGLVR